MVSQISLLVLSLFLTGALGETGCPPIEDISPCNCTYKPTVRVTCEGLTSTTALSEAFRNTSRYTFQEVHIKSATLQFLPHELLENAVVKELYIHDSKMATYFDRAPEQNRLETLVLENTSVMRAKETGNLRTLTNLKVLKMSRNMISKIDSKMMENIPKSLRQLSFVGTLTKKIEAGAFDKFTDLDKVEISSKTLLNISRDVFSVPFNARFLYLDDNELSHLPNDMFVDMPNLQLLSLRNNGLTEIAKSALGERTQKVPFVRLEGNPLSCNCLLVWLIQDKPEVIGGVCASPKRLQGRQLQDMRPGEFNC